MADTIEVSAIYVLYQFVCQCLHLRAAAVAQSAQKLHFILGKGEVFGLLQHALHHLYGRERYLPLYAGKQQPCYEGNGRISFDA